MKYLLILAMCLIPITGNAQRGRHAVPSHLMPLSGETDAQYFVRWAVSNARNNPIRNMDQYEYGDVASYYLQYHPTHPTTIRMIRDWNIMYIQYVEYEARTNPPLHLPTNQTEALEAWNNIQSRVIPRVNHDFAPNGETTICLTQADACIMLDAGESPICAPTQAQRIYHERHHIVHVEFN